MKSRMKKSQLLYLAPLLIILLIFSFYPIATSFAYSTFDYRTNNQQYNALRLSAELNGDLLAENAEYISYFLSDDYDYVDAEGQAVFDQVMTQAEDIAARYRGLKMVNEEQKVELETFFEESWAAISGVYDRLSDADLIRGEDLRDLYRSMPTVFIESNFVGLDHYKRLLKDSRFHGDLGHTLLFTVISVSLELVLGMGLALIMNKAMRGIGLIRTAALVPWAIPTAVSALMWQYLYDGRSGIVAHFLASLGLISSAEAMLSTASGAMAAAIIADVWKTTPLHGPPPPGWLTGH